MRSGTPGLSAMGEDVVSETILIVEEDLAVIEALGETLRGAGFSVSVATGITEAVTRLRRERPALVVVEVGLERRRGFEFCRRLGRGSATRHIPVIALSDLATEADRILGFESGADDYVIKPFSPQEMILRIHRSLERAMDREPAVKKIELGPLMLDPMRHEVTVHHQPVHLTVTEFRILTLCMEHFPRVLERKIFYDEIWGQSLITRTLDQHVSRLRCKLGALGEGVENIQGVGYRLREDVFFPLVKRKNGRAGLEPEVREEISPLSV